MSRKPNQLPRKGDSKNNLLLRALANLRETFPIPAT